VPRDINAYMLERSKKRAAERGPVPRPLDWADRQPEQWRLLCSVFAVNVNTTGGIVGLPLNKIVGEARKRGLGVSKRTVERYLPDLEANGIIKGIRMFDSRTQRREPTTWILELRNTMPDLPVRPEDRREFIEQYNAWIKSNGANRRIAEMNARVAAQSPEPPF
jgi:hypothetical protein